MKLQDKDREGFRDKLETWVIYAVIAVLILSASASLVLGAAQLFGLI